MKKIKEFFNFFVELYKDVKKLKKSNKELRKITQEIERSTKEILRLEVILSRINKAKDFKELSELDFELHKRE